MKTLNQLQPVATPTIATLTMRVMAEFADLPGLAVTESQARRLWNLDEAQCRGVLGALIDVGFLRVTQAGCYVRDR